MSKIFGRANLNWLTNDFFKKLSVRNTGLSIAILKVFLALAIESDYQSRIVKVSYTSLEVITGLSRPLVARAIKALTEEGLISIVDSGRGKINTYIINDTKAKGWAKIPYRSINSELKKLSNRSPSTLGALKVFLVLLRHKNNKLDVTLISSNKLREQTNLQNSKLTMYKDILINHSFIQVGRVLENSGMLEKNPNMYHIVGLKMKKEQQIPTRDELDRIFNSYK